MFLVFALAALAAVDVPESSYDQAIDAIEHNKPRLALEYYINVTDGRQQEEILEGLISLSPHDYEADDLTFLISTLETWNHLHLNRKIVLTKKWENILTAKSPLLKQQYTTEPNQAVDKPPVKILWPPVPAGMVRLYSFDNQGFYLPRAYATNPAISEWLTTVFKEPSRTSIQVSRVPGFLLEHVVTILNNIGELWEWAVKNFPTKIEQEAEIIKVITNDLKKNPKELLTTDKNIFELIKAADAFEAPLALRLYLQRLAELNKSASEIKKGLEEHRHLWPGWMKGMATGPAVTLEVQKAFLDLQLPTTATAAQVKASFEMLKKENDPSKKPLEKRSSFKSKYETVQRAYEVLKKHLGFQ